MHLLQATPSRRRSSSRTTRPLLAVLVLVLVRVRVLVLVPSSWPT